MQPCYPNGIDVSVWQGDITTALVDCEFGCARASIGNSVDHTYVAHAAAIRKAGLVLGAYHYLVPSETGTIQVNTFLKSASDADFFALDMESTALKVPKIAEWFISYLRKIDTRHRKILLYSSEGTWPGDMGQDANWVAKWSTTEPAIRWKFWQYQGAPLDKDVYNGSLAELKKFVGVK